jgi:hypothetical protein
MWYKNVKFWAVVVGAVGSVIAYFNNEIAEAFKTVATALMKALFVTALIITCAPVPACGPGTLPAIVAGVSAVGEFLDLFEEAIKPEYAEATVQCANTIADLPYGTATLTEVNAACAELNGAYVMLQNLVEQYRSEKMPRSEALPAEAQTRLDQWYESRARYTAAMKRVP